jgi:hypothetical protein
VCAKLLPANTLLGLACAAAPRHSIAARFQRTSQRNIEPPKSPLV